RPGHPGGDGSPAGSLASAGDSHPADADSAGAGREWPTGRPCLCAPHRANSRGRSLATGSDIAVSTLSGGGYTLPRRRPTHSENLSMRKNLLLVGLSVGLSLPSAGAADPQVDPYDQSKVSLEV